MFVKKLKILFWDQEDCDIIINKEVGICSLMTL